jgi:sugar phosphate isomerase/epimerase
MFNLGLITDQVSMDFEAALKEIKELGLKYIEIHALWNKNIEELDEAEISEARRLMDKYELEVSIISSTLFLQCHLENNGKSFEDIDDYFITIYGTYEEHLKTLEHCIELCKIFDTDKIRTFGFIRDNSLDGDTALEKITQMLQKPVEMVEKAGLTLVLENCPFSLLTNGNLTSRVIENLSSKSIKALWDPANALRAGDSPYPQDYKKVRTHMAHMHAKDIVLSGTPRMVPLGEGVINYRGILGDLVDDGYEGVISLEPEYVDEKGGRPEGCRRSVAGIRKILSQMGINA